MYTWTVENVAFVGTGRFGAQMAARFANSKGVSAVAIGLEEDAESTILPAARKLILKTDLVTKGNMQNGELAADQAQDGIKRLIVTELPKFKNFIVLAGAGGGFGGGSVLVIVETIKKILSDRGVADVDERVGVALFMPALDADELQKKNAGFLATALSDHFAKKSLINPYVVFPFERDPDKSMHAIVNLIEDQNLYVSVALVRYPREEEQTAEPLRPSRLPPQPTTVNVSVNGPAGKKNVYGE